MLSSPPKDDPSPLRGRGIGVRGRESEPLAALAREHALRMVHRAKASHIGAALSMVDILAVLYADVLRVRPEKPRWPERDRLIVSKGHGAVGLSAVLGERGFFPKAEFETYGKDGARLMGHVSHHVPGVAGLLTQRHLLQALRQSFPVVSRDEDEGDVAPLQRFRQGVGRPIRGRDIQHGEVAGPVTDHRQGLFEAGIGPFDGAPRALDGPADIVGQKILVLDDEDAVSGKGLHGGHDGSCRAQRRRFRQVNGS